MNDAVSQAGAAHAETEPSQPERREWVRFLDDVTEVTLWSDSVTSRQAEVRDESYTGISLLVDDASQLAPEQEVILTYRGIPMMVAVKHITPVGEGRQLVGCEWR